MEKIKPSILHCSHRPPDLYVVKKNEQGLDELVACRLCAGHVRIRSRATWYCPTCKGRHACFVRGNSWTTYMCPDAFPRHLASRRIFEREEMGPPQTEVLETTVEPASTSTSHDG